MLIWSLRSRSLYMYVVTLLSVCSWQDQILNPSFLQVDKLFLLQKINNKLNTTFPIAFYRKRRHWSIIPYQRRVSWFNDKKNIFNKIASGSEWGAVLRNEMTDHINSTYIWYNRKQLCCMCPLTGDLNITHITSAHS